MVSTKYKQESEIDLKKSMEVTLLRITRSAKYDCKTGFWNWRRSGLKSYRTFSRFNIDSKDSEKLYYEVVLFSQEGGLQQIMIFHEEGDTYANEISDRVLSLSN
jgi:hypothetical protein